MRTNEKLELICDSLTTNCGDLHAAARQNGVSPYFLATWIKEDKIAADRIQEAQRIGRLGLESEAIRRAVHGVEEDVWFKGETVGTKTVYSDGLLGKLLEGNLTQYNKKEGQTTTFTGPTQINIMPRANSYEEWLAMKDATLDEGRSLPAPQATVPDILQGEYVELEDALPLAELKGLGL